MPHRDGRLARTLSAQHIPPMLFAHFVGDAGRERIEADIVACPARTLECRAFPTTTGAACMGTQLVARSVRPPQNDSDSASKRRVMLAALTPKPNPKASFAVARRVSAVVQLGAWP